MKIEYTYADKERPIKKAEFKSSVNSKCEIIIYTEKFISFRIPQDGNGTCTPGTRLFNKPDLADLIALLQRFHKQLPEAE